MGALEILMLNSGLMDGLLVLLTEQNQEEPS